MPAKTHGDSYTQEYRSWKMMWSRCRNPNDPAYKNYGGRGITVCPRWGKYENFLRDMGRRPTPKHTLERIDNELPYDPGNCKWATRYEQLRNKRTNVFVLVDGQRMVSKEAARLLGLPYTTFRHRLQRGLLHGVVYA